MQDPMDPMGGMGGGMPQYPGAYGAMKQQMADYIGLPQLNDILGVGQEGDVEMVAAEFSPGPPVPLGQLGEGGGMPGAGMMGAGMPDMGGGEDPMGGEDDSDTARVEMKDFLSERSKSRLSASQAFQAKAGKMMGQ